MLTLKKDLDTACKKETWWHEGIGMWKSQEPSFQLFYYSEVKCETFYIDHLGNTGFLDVVNNRFSNRQLGNPQNWKQLLIQSEPL